MYADHDYYTTEYGGKMSADDVAPFAGAWIEISSPFIFSSISFVAPFAGA